MVTRSPTLYVRPTQFPAVSLQGFPTGQVAPVLTLGELNPTSPLTFYYMLSTSFQHTTIHRLFAFKTLFYPDPVVKRHKNLAVKIHFFGY